MILDGRTHRARPEDPNQTNSDHRRIHRRPNGSHMRGRLAALAIAAAATLALAGPGAWPAGAADDFGLSARFPTQPALSGFGSDSDSLGAASSSRAGRPTGSPFVWQPLPLRATFRPINRPQQPPEPPAPPQTPRVPRPPRPPSAPGRPALSISERSVAGSGDSAAAENLFAPSVRLGLEAAVSGGASGASFLQPPNEPTTGSPPASSPTLAPSLAADDDADERPTRQPMNRFRPTRAPAEDEDSSGGPANLTLGGSSSSVPNGALQVGSGAIAPNRISSECFECICEASTNCNVQSRCQTSDVRNTRCGLFLISYDQWLATGLSHELVSRDALARDAAADERAFYECVTNRDCAERLLTIYMGSNQKDCDRDGRIDCYDMAAIHHSGMEQCASESLLDSQYWSDFNACLGFGRR